MKKKISVSVLLSLTTAVFLAACGSTKYDSAASYASPEEAYAYEEAEEYYSDDLYDNSGTFEAKATSESADSAATDAQLEGQSSNRKLIRTVNMSVQTKEFDDLIATVSSRIESLGGYAESMEVSGYEYNASQTSVRSAYIVARIPAPKMDSFINAVSENSNIISKNESARDVTLEYTDVEAHRNSLRVEQERLNELLEEADSLETIVALEQRLTEVRYELESYESRLRSIDNQVDYSTIYLDVSEVKDYTPVITEEPSFGERIVEGFTEGCAGAAEALGNFIVGFITILPGLVVFLVCLGVIVLIIFGIVKLIINIVKKTGAKTSAKKGKKKKATNSAVALDTKPEITDDGNKQE